MERSVVCQMGDRQESSRGREWREPRTAKQTREGEKEGRNGKNQRQKKRERTHTGLGRLDRDGCRETLRDKGGWRKRGKKTENQPQCDWRSNQEKRRKVRITSHRGGGCAQPGA